MRGKWILISLAAVVAGIAGGALSFRYRRDAATGPARTAGAVIVRATDVNLSGNIRPQHITGVPAPAGIEGNIEAFLVEVGQDVFEGQVLARIGAAGLETARDAAANALENARDQAARTEAALSTAMLEASRTEANAERSRLALDRADKAFTRQRTLLAAGATPRLTYQKVEQEYNETRAEFTVMDRAVRAARDEVQNVTQRLAAARERVADRTRQLDEAQSAIAAAELRSPVDGTVVGRNGEQGKPVEEAGKDVFQIATDIYALEVALDAPPDTLKRIHPGQSALVLILDLQSAGLAGEVKSVDSSQVVVQFNSNAPAIRPGMRADVRLKLD
jgi:multidrug resistance efflux pump